MSRSWETGSRKGWRRIRQRILIRDSYTCQRCGTGEGPMHVDHIIPKRLNGPDSEENLQTLCQSCNLQKGGRFFSDDRTPPTLHARNLPENLSVSHD